MNRKAGRDVMKGFEELLAVRDAPGTALPPAVQPTFSGADPVFSTRFRVAETGAAVLGAIGVAVSDIWHLKTGRSQSVSVDVRGAGAALKSFEFLERREPDGSYQVMGNSPLAATAYQITQPWPTKDGRWFLPHFGIAHMKKRVLDVLECEDNPKSVGDAVLRWNGEELEDAIAEVGACGGMVRDNAEWLAHPHGAALAAQPVVEVEKIGDSPPEPFAPDGRALAGVRVLDLTRILAGPVAARTCAEHGADVLMVGAKGVPQIRNFVVDLSHGKRSCYLDLNEPREASRLRDLVRGADVFSQGYRPGVLDARGFGAEELAAIRPGLIHASISCFGNHGPFQNRAGWEQVAQSMVGICHESGEARPALLPVPACDYLTGYLGAYGILLALARRAVEGGSYRVNVSLCQSGMFLYRQERVDFPEPDMNLSAQEVAAMQMEASSDYGDLRYLAPVIKFSETKSHWSHPSPALGSHAPEWLPR
ncbi:MAG: CoA transferase [Gammaproteobacteria bacterium]|nr:CoA transferase [Gammaproteobacteria bacterium]